FAPPRLSEPRNVDADAQAVETSWDTDRPDARTFDLRAAMSCSPISGWFTAGIGVCHVRASFGHRGAGGGRDGPTSASVAREQRAGKRVRELARMLVEAPRDLLVGRVHLQ